MAPIFKVFFLLCAVGFILPTEAQPSFGDQFLRRNRRDLGALFGKVEHAKGDLAAKFGVPSKEVINSVIQHFPLFRDFLAKHGGISLTGSITASGLGNLLGHGGAADHGGAGGSGGHDVNVHITPGGQGGSGGQGGNGGQGAAVVAASSGAASSNDGHAAAQASASAHARRRRGIPGLDMIGGLLKVPEGVLNSAMGMLPGGLGNIATMPLGAVENVVSGLGGLI